LYLSKLEIFGFKSFAQKTSVKFNEGVTSIVGPNGCGKTNIVDAIRWCLGEQRSSALRSDKMENVIFNGTSAKKPMGMAEVSLVIENTKGILPTEYTDVTITRRIFRSGESEYLLNKNICRLKDIVNLFMDTGIGANAYSVIELKMVETILSSKAEERRVLFEEAAGVNKYKLRRRLALRKLEEVKNDLTRVADIVSEVTKTVNSLERQARKADRYNNLSTTLRELELGLAEREFCLFENNSKELVKKREELFSNRMQLDSDVNRSLDELSKLRNESQEIEQSLKEKRTEVENQTEKIFNVKNLFSVSDERKNSLEANIKRSSVELDELKNRLTATEQEISEYKTRIEETGRLITESEQKQNVSQDSVEERKEKLEKKRARIKSQSDIIVDQMKILSTRENDFENLKSSLAVKNNAINELNKKVQFLTNDVAKTVGYIENLSEERESVTQKLNEAESDYTLKLAEKETLERELSKLRNDELESRGVLKSIEEKILFVQNLVDNLEGVSKGTKELLTNTKWISSQPSLLANVGSAEENYRPAIEAALKNNLSSILVNSIDQARKGLMHLKNNELGRASFIVKNNSEPGKISASSIQNFLFKRKRKKLSKQKGFINWTSNLLKTEKNWSPFFENILYKIALVENIETAIDLSNRFGEFSFVTTDGEFIDSNGVIEGGSPIQIEESLFGKKQQLDEFKNELPVRKSRLESLSAEIKSREDKIGNIDLKLLSEKGRMLVNELANLDKQIAQIEFEKKKANDEIEKLYQQIQNLASESNKVDNQLIESSKKLDEANNNAELARRALNEMEEEFRSFEDEYNTFVSSFNDMKLDQERLFGEKRNLESSVQQAESGIETINKTIDRRKSDIENATNEISILLDKITNYQTEITALENVKSELQADEGKIESGYRKIKAELTDLETKVNNLRSDKDKISDEVRDADIRANEIKMKKQNLVEHIDENYSIRLELKSFDDLDTYDFKNKSAEVHELKQRIRNLGPINLLAYSEFEEEKKRMEFLNKQRDDLVESEKDVIQTIEEINRTAQEKFAETFNQIKENFINVFRTLFDPGDEADLRIEENADPLEAKIEIIAKPKGKRPTSIELLSGGEKTLTAIALLFAIYLVKPSPFCILDEIDAPLDDANIDRFTRILKDFSKETQFIVVTHNKRTMESAETLYGVTMQEEGVSKLVSVRFNEDLNLVS
jgi:chromosome segregation protein